jgi:hypothetical protein
VYTPDSQKHEFDVHEILGVFHVWQLWASGCGRLALTVLFLFLVSYILIYLPLLYRGPPSQNWFLELSSEPY